MDDQHTLLPEMQRAVAQHKVTEFTETGGVMEFDLSPEEIAKIEDGAKRYNCSVTVFIRALIDCMFNVWQVKERVPA